MIFVSQGAHAAKLPHYIFILPDGYTGWIQVIFDSPGSAPLVLEHDNAVLKIKDDGVIRLPIPGHVFVGSHDDFFYERTDAKGKAVRVLVPSDYVCTESSGMDSCYNSKGDLSDGFTVGRATIGKPSDGTPGNSWWLFVGPPDLRKKWARPITRNSDPKWPYQIDVPANDPTPGRIK
jgi:hypothetical protein